MYPQAVYFPIRTLYLTLKIEQREKHKSAEQAVFAGKFASSVSINMKYAIYYKYSIIDPNWLSYRIWKT